MVAAAKRSGQPNMTGFTKRFFPGAQLAQDIIAEGDLGDIYHLEGHYIQGWRANPTHFQRLAMAGGGAWRLLRDRAGSGALGDLGSHLFDLARCWTGEATSVTALTRTYTNEFLLSDEDKIQVDVDDTASFVVAFENGALGTFTASRMANGVSNEIRLDIYGSRGAMRFSSLRRDELEVCLGERSCVLEAFASVKVPQWRYDGEIATFVEAVRQSTPVRPSFEDGLRCQEFLDAVLTSAATGQRVDLQGSEGASS
jgi:predicted dehydrogenase